MLSEPKKQHPQSTSAAIVFFLAWDSSSLRNQHVHEAVLTEGHGYHSGDLGEGRRSWSKDPRDGEVSKPGRRRLVTWVMPNSGRSDLS